MEPRGARGCTSGDEPLAAIAVGIGAVWVANAGDCTLGRIVW
jgi:hypothetical protein